MFRRRIYLDKERRAAEKSEYIEGAIVAVTGGSPGHALIAMSAGAILHRDLSGGAAFSDLISEFRCKGDL